MTKPIKSFPKKRVAAGAVVLAGTLFVGGQRVYELSAEPVGEKDCGPVVNAATAQNAPADVSVKPVAAPFTWAQQGGTINDASCLNRTPIYGVVKVQSEEEIREALHYASENGLKISIAGVRHSMGGQAFFTNAVVLDTTGFNRVALNEEEMTISVQSGATWHDIQEYLHPRYAVKAMQSTDIFTVGGSISVNAHGMDHQVGALGNTIRSLRLMLPDGTVQTLSRTQNPELFRLVIGGYGLFGIVLDAELEITENAIYESDRRIIDYRDFPALFAETLAPDKGLGLMYSHLSTAPDSLLQEMILYTYHEVEMPDAVVPPLGEGSAVGLRRFVLNFSKLGDLPMRLKWFAEKNIEPLLESCTVTRNQAMKDGEACMVSRNEPMHDSVPYLRNRLPNDTDILQEYFIPRQHFVPFVDGLRQIVRAHDVNLLNASVRVVHQEENFLNYAPTEMFSLVLYINQETTPEANAKMREVTGELIDLTLGFDGTFFLPYQLYYTPAQLRQAYPNIDEFFAAKRQIDPDLLLTNTFFEKFGASPTALAAPGK